MRHTFVALGLQSVVNAFVYSTYLARLPDIRDQVDLSLGALGLVMTVGNVAGLAATFVAGPAVRRWGTKRVMVGGGVTYVCALPAVGDASGPVMLVVAVVVMMITNSLVDMALAMQSAALSARRERPVLHRLAGLYSLGAVAGGGAASLIAAAGIDPSVHLVVLAAVLALSLCGVSSGLMPTDETPSSTASSTGRSWWQVGVPALVLGTASALTVPLDVVPGEWATFRARDDLGSGAGVGTAAYLCFALGMASGRLCGDALVVRAGRRRVFAAAVMLSAAGVVVAATVPAIPVVLLGFFVAGLGVAPQTPVLTEVAASTPGPAFTALFFGNRLAGLATPFAMGSLAAAASSVGTAMVVVVVPCAVVLLAAAGVALRRRGGPG